MNNCNSLCNQNGVHYRECPNYRPSPCHSPKESKQTTPVCINLEKDVNKLNGVGHAGKCEPNCKCDIAKMANPQSPLTPEQGWESIIVHNLKGYGFTEKQISMVLKEYSLPIHTLLSNQKKRIVEIGTKLKCCNGKCIHPYNQGINDLLNLI